MNRTRHILSYSSRKYVMTQEEAAKWDRSADHERRVMLGALGDRLALETQDSEGCSVNFYHANGKLVGKSTLHRPLFGTAEAG